MTVPHFQAIHASPTVRRRVCAPTSLDSTPGEQHNAYTFFVTPGYHAFLGRFAKKRGCAWNV